MLCQTLTSCQHHPRLAIFVELHVEAGSSRTAPRSPVPQAILTQVQQSKMMQKRRSTPDPSVCLPSRQLPSLWRRTLPLPLRFSPRTEWDLQQRCETLCVKAFRYSALPIQLRSVEERVWFCVLASHPRGDNPYHRTQGIDGQ